MFCVSVIVLKAYHFFNLKYKFFVCIFIYLELGYYAIIYRIDLSCPIKTSTGIILVVNKIIKM